MSDIDIEEYRREVAEMNAQGEQQRTARGAARAVVYALVDELRRDLLLLDPEDLASLLDAAAAKVRADARAKLAAERQRKSP